MCASRRVTPCHAAVDPRYRARSPSPLQRHQYPSHVTHTPHRTSAAIEEALAGRLLEDACFVTASSGRVIDPHTGDLVVAPIASRAAIAVETAVISIRSEESADMVEVRVSLPRLIARGSGIGAAFRLVGWANIDYVAVGYTHADGTFQHLKVPHPDEEGPITLVWAHDDLAFLVPNNFASPIATAIKDVRIWVKGTASAYGAGVDIEWVGAWRGSTQAQLSIGDDASRARAKTAITQLSRALQPYELDGARNFLTTGQLRIASGVHLAWAPNKDEPDNIDQNISWAYRFHSFHHVSHMLGLAIVEQSEEALSTAVSWAWKWLRTAMHEPKPNMKYAWYEHAVAERLNALALLDIVLTDCRRDIPWRAELVSAIYAHALLLESETFYARDQPVRFHNHACFQDIALALVASLYATKPGGRWVRTAYQRLTTQIEQLMPQEANMRALNENSIGYQTSLEGILTTAVEFAPNPVLRRYFHTALKESVAFREVCTYADGRAPATGDSPRKPNARLPVAAGRGREVTVLPKAGYAIAHGDVRGEPFTFAFLATAATTTHKHEDSLSFTLYYAGVEWFVDPGFLSYEMADPRARYLREASAHNAVVIPDGEYNPTPGHATLSGKRQSRTRFTFAGRHGAYASAQVKREIVGRLDRLDVRATDSHTAKGERVVGVFHLADMVTARPARSGYILRHGESRETLMLRIPRNVTTSVVSGWSGDPLTSSISATSLGVSLDTQSIIVEFGKRMQLSWRISAHAHVNALRYRSRANLIGRSAR